MRSCGSPQIQRASIFWDVAPVRVPRLTAYAEEDIAEPGGRFRPPGRKSTEPESGAMAEVLLGLDYVVIRSGVYGTPRNASHTCRRPNRSKWLMRNVVASTITQPAAYAVNTAARAAPPVTSQTTPPSGCHCQNSTKRAALDRSTYVLRSAGSGTKRVSHRLKAGRAIPLCCTANSASSPTLIARAAASDPWRGPSNCVGVRNPPTNPTA